ncbi:MAG: TRAP transporter small permease [Desulfuromusa sp.]|nr:TRAP transporter small permease [Desulfuromusa sp.]
MTTLSSKHPVSTILNGMVGILDYVTKLSCYLSGLALAAICLLTLNEVSMRYFLNSPTSWSSDVNQWFFALAVILVIPEIARTNGHIAITVLVERLPHRKKEIACRALAFISCLMCLATFYITGMETLRQYSAGIETMWVSPIPKWWISIAIPFGFLLTTMQFLRLGVMPDPENK